MASGGCQYSDINNNRQVNTLTTQDWTYPNFGKCISPTLVGILWYVGGDTGYPQTTVEKGESLAKFYHKFYSLCKLGENFRGPNMGKIH